MKQTFKNIALFAALWSLLPLAGQAQPVRIDTMTIRHEGDSIPFEVVYVQTLYSFKNLKINQESFPVAIMPYEMIGQITDIVNSHYSLGTDLETEIALMKQRDTLHEIESRTLRDIIDNQQKNIDLCERTNTALNTSIQSLNNQLQETRNLASEANRGRVRRSIWGVLLGTGIGFGLGVLLGAVVK